jgi:hypothetical protein
MSLPKNAGVGVEAAWAESEADAGLIIAAVAVPGVKQPAQSITPRSARSRLMIRFPPSLMRDVSAAAAHDGSCWPARRPSIGRRYAATVIVESRRAIDAIHP